MKQPAAKKIENEIFFECNEMKQTYINFENDQSISFKIMSPANKKNVVSKKTRSMF